MPRNHAVHLPLGLLCSLFLVGEVRAGDGYVGIYADAQATTPCTALPQGVGTTLYVVAKLAGASAYGITGAEFRIEVSDPSGYYLSFTPSLGATTLGNVFDLDAGDPNNAAGSVLGFPCHTDTSGTITLGFISIYNASGGPTTLTVKRRTPPSNSVYSCPLFVLCDDPYFTKVCMSPGGSSTCTLSKVTATQASDPAVFSAEVNVDDRAEGTGRDIVLRLVREYNQPINFIQALDEQNITVSMAASVEDIVDQVTQRDPGYQEVVIDGRTIVLPVNSPYTQEVMLPDSVANDVPQVVAWRGYARWLRNNVAGLENLGGPTVISTGPKDPTPEHITLQRRGTILEHLVQLLGSESTRLFMIDTGRSGRPALNFPKIPPQRRPTASESSKPRGRMGELESQYQEDPCPCVPSGMTYTEIGKIHNTCASYECGLEWDFAVTMLHSATECFCEDADWTEFVTGEDCEGRWLSVTQCSGCPWTTFSGGTIQNFTDKYEFCLGYSEMDYWTPCTITLAQKHSACGIEFELATIKVDLTKGYDWLLGDVCSDTNHSRTVGPPYLAPAFRCDLAPGLDLITMEVNQNVTVPFRLTNAVYGSVTVNASVSAPSFLNVDPQYSSVTVPSCTIAENTPQSTQVRVTCNSIGVGALSLQTTSPQMCSDVIQVECLETVGGCGTGGGCPEARVGSFVGVGGSGGVRLLWYTTKEERTATFDITRASTPAGPFTPIGSAIAHAGTDTSGVGYEVLDPSGASGDYYMLMETETGGTHTQCAPVTSADEPYLTTSPQHLQVVSGPNFMYEQSSLLEPPLDALIICPDAWVDSLQALRSHWRDFRWHGTVIVPLSQTGTTKEDIRSYILSALPDTGDAYVLLVGDSSNRLEPANTIPTWYIKDSTFQTATFATDARYGDRDGDWLADVAIGRWPAHTSTEVATCAKKSIDYDLQDPNQAFRQRWTGFTYDITSTGVNGDLLRSLGDGLLAMTPADIGAVQHRASEIPCCYANREQTLIQAVNAGTHLVWTLGTAATQHVVSYFLSNATVADYCDPPPNHLLTAYDPLDMSRLEASGASPFWLALSCHLAGFDIADTYDCLRDTYIRPIAEDLLIARDRGALTWFGPTRGSAANHNGLLGREVLQHLSLDRTSSVGQICMRAVKVLATTEASERFHAASYVFLGDPTLVMAWSDVPTDATARTHGIDRGLSISPNPGRTSFQMTLALVQQAEGTLSIYDVAGRRVRVLVHGDMKAGRHRFSWDARDDRGAAVPAGIYLVRLQTTEGIHTRKFIVLK